jgi:hypothetical protein
MVSFQYDFSNNFFGKLSSKAAKKSAGGAALPP